MSLSAVSKMAGRIAAGHSGVYAVLQSIFVQGGVLAVNLATGIVTARLLGPEGRGIFTAVTIWPQLLGMLATAGIAMATSYRVGRDPEARGRVVGAALLLSASIAAIGAMILASIVPHVLDQYDGGVVLFAQIGCFVAVGTAMQNVVNGTLIGIKAYTFSNLCRFGPQALYLAALLGVAVSVGLDWRSAALSLFLGGLAALILVLPRFAAMTAVSLRGVRDAVSSILSYVLRAAPADILAALSSFGDRILLVPLISPAELGFYVVALSLSRVVVLMMAAVNGVLFSSLTHSGPAGAGETYQHVFRFALVTLALVACFLFLASQWVLVLLYGRDFQQIIPLFRLLLLDAVLSSLSAITIALFQAMDRPGYVSGVETLRFGLLVIGILVLAPLYGAMGAATALLFASCVQFFLYLIGIKVYLRLPLPRPYLTSTDFRYLLVRLRLS